MKFLSGLFDKKPAPLPKREAAPMEVIRDSSPPFSLQQHLYSHEGLLILDWEAALAWSEGGEADDALWKCQRAWLLHLRDALGPAYELYESRQGAVLSCYEERSARVMLDFIDLTRRRIANTLEGVAAWSPARRELLIVFHDEDTYYRYVSHVYPEDGEFAFSSGMFLHAGCPHFVTMHAETATIERVIAHEMTHAGVAHLKLPLWVNEGLAVNVEDRLMGVQPKLFTPAEMRDKHLAFWNRETIQQFWSGQAFGRPDDGCMLSYDLAKILVEILAGHWPQFREFANHASYEDAGSDAAHDRLGLDLGAAAASIFEQSSDDGWRPDPNSWRGEVAHTPE